MVQKRTYSVSNVNNYIKNLIGTDYLLKNICVKGEVSNCKYHSMGHIYFSLKDEESSMSCVMFKGSLASGLKFRLADGQSVLVTGSINVYERDGKYQLYAKSITLDGAGRLYEEYEMLKMRLAEEGLFDFEIKKTIPRFPKRVGIVTAPTGAAIQDIKNIAKRRNPYVELILYPAKVQGEGAADTIVKGIQVLDKMGLDTIIIGRGGGSIEDMWAFNEEKVARAIYAAKTPIISGTGHDTDNTIADYAADLRAPTPSAACELAIPDVMADIISVRKLKDKLKTEMERKLSMTYYELKVKRLNLEKLSPVAQLDKNKIYLADLYDKMTDVVKDKINRMKHALQLYTVRLDGLSPTAKLINGYGYIEKNGSPLISLKEVSEGDIIEITVNDGSLISEVKEINIK